MTYIVDMSHHHHKTGNLKVAFFLNLVFTVIEIIGGIYTGSLAILSDALHDLGDSFSIGLSWYFQKLANRKSDKKYSFGYRRYSVLGALINAIILFIGSVFILSEAIPAIWNPNEVDEAGMLVIAVFGVLVNGAAVLRLKGATSLNEKVISLHLLEDVLGWMAVLIGALLIMFLNWYIIDPILSVLISLYIIYNVFKNLRMAISIMMQSIPASINLEDIEKTILALPEVSNVHDCRVWSMDGEYNVLSAHVVLHKECDISTLTEVKCQIKGQLIERGINHSTLEFERPEEACDQFEH